MSVIAGRASHGTTGAWAVPHRISIPCVTVSVLSRLSVRGRMQRCALEVAAGPGGQLRARTLERRQEMGTTSGREAMKLLRARAIKFKAVPRCCNRLQRIPPDHTQHRHNERSRGSRQGTHAPITSARCTLVAAAHYVVSCRLSCNTTMACSSQTGQASGASTRSHRF